MHRHTVRYVAPSTNYIYKYIIKSRSMKKIKTSYNFFKKTAVLSIYLVMRVPGHMQALSLTVLDMYTPYVSR
jgi:hypothetical protein